MTFIKHNIYLQRKPCLSALDGKETGLQVKENTTPNETL